MPNTIESPSRRSHSKETFPEIEINKIRRAQIINIFGYLKKLDNRVTKLEKKRKWWWCKKDKKTARNHLRESIISSLNNSRSNDSDVMKFSKEVINFVKNRKNLEKISDAIDYDSEDEYYQEPNKLTISQKGKKSKSNSDFESNSDDEYSSTDMAIAMAESLKHEKPEKSYNVLNAITSISSDVDSEDMDNEVSELIKKSLSDNLDIINNAKDRIAALKSELEECTDVLNSLINK